MTGRQKRELSSYEEIHDRHTRPDESYVPTGVYVCVCVCVCVFVCACVIWNVLSITPLYYHRIQEGISARATSQHPVTGGQDRE